MKKLMSIFFTLFLLLSPLTQVHAATFSASISAPTQITAGQQFTVTVGVSNVTNMSGFSATFSYDTNKLSLVSSTGLNNFTLTLGPKIVVDSVSPKSGTFSIATIVFKAKTTFTIGQSTNISLSNVEYSNGTSDFTGVNKSIAIKMVSDNTYLKALSVSQGSLNFSKTTTNYTVVVENSVSSLVIGATAEESSSSVSGAGTKNLSVYTNSFNIVVKAANGSTRTYTIVVKRKDANGLASPPSSNNFLSKLIIEGFNDFNAAFNKTTLEYTLEVGNLITTLNITTSAENSGSKIEMSPTALVLGPNTITVKVTAESGDLRTYTILVNRSSDVPTVNEDEIINALQNVTTPTIGLNAPVSGEISLDILNALKGSGKTLIVVAKEAGITRYEWLIDGTKLLNPTMIKTKISFDTLLKSEIDKITNFAQGIILTFEENPTLPENTIVRLMVSDTYQDGDYLLLYFYNTVDGKLSITSQDLLVENGKVEFTLTHTSTYFLSQTILKKPVVTNYLFMFVSIGEACIIVLLLLFKRRPRKPKRALPEN